MTVKEQTSKDAFKEGYLEKKRVYLKPVIRGGKMVTKPEHVAYFQYEGASNWFALPLDERTNTLVNPFVSEEEQQYFEKRLDTDLGIYKKKPDNFWHSFFVKVTKDFALMSDGYVFNLADPLDNLRYRVTKLQPFVAPSWEERFDKAEYRFALVDEGYEDEVESDSANSKIEAYTFLGSIQNSATKMRDFLGIYLMQINSDKMAPVDADKKWLKTELKKIIEEDIKIVLSLINDPNWEIKKLIFDGILSDAVIKEGRNKYKLPGEGVSNTYPELIAYLKKAEEVKSDVFLKLKAQVKMNKK